MKKYSQSIPSLYRNTLVIQGPIKNRDIRLLHDSFLLHRIGSSDQRGCHNESGCYVYHSESQIIREYGSLQFDYEVLDEITYESRKICF